MLLVTRKDDEIIAVSKVIFFPKSICAPAERQDDRPNINTKTMILFISFPFIQLTRCMNLKLNYILSIDMSINFYA